MPNDNTDNQEIQSAEPEVKSAVPSLDEFKNLTTEEMEKALAAAQVSNDQESNESEPETEDSQAEQSSEGEQDPEPKSDKQAETENEGSEESKDDKGEDLKTQIQALQKSYKELQAEFTRRSQELKELKTGNASSKDKANAETAEQLTQDYNDLLALAEGDAESTKFLKGLGKAMQAMIDKSLGKVEKVVDDKIAPVKEQFVRQGAEANLNKFVAQVDAFKASPIGALTEEINAIIAESYADNDALAEAAKKDPSIFKQFEKELYYRHPEKVAALKAAKTSKGDTDPLKRHEALKTGVSGKSRTSASAPASAEDLKTFNSMSLAEQEKFLKSKGRIAY